MNRGVFIFISMGVFFACALSGTYAFCGQTPKKGYLAKKQKYLDNGTQEIVSSVFDDGQKRTEAVLNHAICAQKLEAVRLLLDHGANVNAINDKSMSTLMYAAAKENLAILALLLSKNPDVTHEKDDKTILELYPELFELSELLDKAHGEILNNDGNKESVNEKVSGQEKLPA